jgi:hypothetical protein
MIVLRRMSRRSQEGLRRASAALLLVVRNCSNQPVSPERVRKFPERVFIISSYRRLVNCVLVAFLFSGCTHLVKISYPPGAVIHPRFDRPFTTWEGQRVQVVLTPSLREETLKYLLSYDQVLLADSIRQNGLRHEYRTAGRGTPLVTAPAIWSSADDFIQS